MTAGPKFATEDVVEVTAGSRKASRGRVVRPTPFMARHYDVRFEDGYTRSIHEDLLRLFDVPAASPSDDDVMSPLRRTSCP